MSAARKSRRSPWSDLVERREKLLALGAVLLSAVTYALVVFGSAVRANGAGLACPDWPLCFGEVVPAIDFGVFFEFGHRALAGSVSLGFLALAIAIFRDRDLRRRLGPLTALAAGVLVIQVVLGGLTVLHLLAEWTVTSHLLAGNTFCLLLLVHALWLREVTNPVDRRPIGRVVRVVGALMAVTVVCQLTIGGLVASSHAGLACGTWPGCNGASWFPTLQGLVGLQVIHRIVGYAVGGMALCTWLVARNHPRVGRAARLLLLLVVAQISIGVANVLFYLPVEVTVLHSAGAAAIVLSTTWLNYEAWRAPAFAPSPARVFGTPARAR